MKKAHIRLHSDNESMIDCPSSLISAGSNPINSGIASIPFLLRSKTIPDNLVMLSIVSRTMDIR